MATLFKDRTDAGNQVAKILATYQGRNAVVLGLPRGGVVVAYQVARLLELPFGIVVICKIGHPDNPEYAVGAVNDKGMVVVDREAREAIDSNWFGVAALAQKNEALRRIKTYYSGKNPVDLNNKIVIIVDDGMATGLTMLLAIRAVKMQKPKKIIVAVPVASEAAKRAIESEGVAECLILQSPQEFMGAIGAHYKHFDQVQDQEVVRLLHLLPARY